jgi:hypothetical protein
MSATSIITRRWVHVAVSLVVLIAWTGGLSAQLPLPVSTQFDITGFLQRATLDSTLDPHSGGMLEVNGHRVVVPRETIVILPANALSWQELFAQAPAPYGLFGTATGLPMTGLAFGDSPRPMASYEVEVVGNRVVGAGGCPVPAVVPTDDCYIAGLIYVSQQGLNNGAGFINWINYQTGELRVGGNIGDNTSGTRVQLNDPVGRYGRAMSPDPRFTVDPDNPTIKSVTGFPMCLPRVDPASAIDPLCPQSNRPAGGILLQMNTPAFVDANPGAGLDPRVQAPLEVGDYISFAGTMMTDNAAAPTAGPYPAAGASSTYISAHTITNNIGIYTTPGVDPAYVETDVFILGTGGLTVLGATEAVIRTRFEGMTTDTGRNVHLYGMDLDPKTGAVTDRDWGFVGVDPGPAGGLGAVMGRWRFRPPCLPFGSNPTKPDKQCVMNAAGTFLPVTREMRAVIEGSWIPGQITTYANGLIAGQYHAPILQYIFPENIPGTPIVENNFEDVPFLAQGGYTSSAGTMGVGRLLPWPGNPALMPPLGVPPVVTVTAGSAVVNANNAVALSATATGSAPISFTWKQSAGTPGTFSATSGANVTWTAPNVPASEIATFQVTATNSAGSALGIVSVTVLPPAPPTLTSVTASNNQMASSGSVTLSAVATGANPISYTWSMLSGPAGGKFSSTVGATVTWTAPAATVSTPVTFQVVASNAVGAASGTVGVTINPAGTPTVNPIAPLTVLTGSAVSFPVSAITTNPKAKLVLSVAQISGTAVANLKVSGGQSCTATSCTGNFTVTFTAPTVAAGAPNQILNFRFIASDQSVTPNLNSAPSTPTPTVTVTADPAPVIAPVAPLSVTSGAAVVLPVTVTVGNPGANVQLTAVQTSNFVLGGLGVAGPAKTCTATSCTFNFTVRFTAPVLPTNPLQVTPDVITLQLTAKDISVVPNTVSAPVIATVTDRPIPDTVTIVSTEYRLGKERLIINAQSSVDNPAVILYLQPYLTASGTIYDPNPIAGGVGNTFTYTGAGVPQIIDLVGAPEPATVGTPIVVTSILGGSSIPTALQKIRQ